MENWYWYIIGIMSLMKMQNHIDILQRQFLILQNLSSESEMMIPLKLHIKTHENFNQNNNKIK